MLEVISDGYSTPVSLEVFGTTLKGIRKTDVALTYQGEEAWKWANKILLNYISDIHALSEAKWHKAVRKNLLQILFNHIWIPLHFFPKGFNQNFERNFSRTKLGTLRENFPSHSEQNRFFHNSLNRFKSQSRSQNIIQSGLNGLF